MDQLFINKGVHSQGVKRKKTYLKKQIVKTIYFTGPLSNADLDRNLNLSTPNINGILADLIKDKLVIDVGK